jgi:hypothetical protein
LTSTAIIISFYAPRPANDLRQLMASLATYKDQSTIVINSDQLEGKPQLHSLAGWQAIAAPNRGMNIGAWQQGFLARPDENFYFFFQDECFIKQTGFFEACLRRFEENSKLGMLGESLNLKWNHPWPAMRNSDMNWKDADHRIDGVHVPRVDYYLKGLERLGIAPGDSGLHLRSLCWAFRGDTLRAIGGFPIGVSKGECITAEIGVSRKVLQHGYLFDQLCPTPFTYIGHREWKADGSGKL